MSRRKGKGQKRSEPRHQSCCSTYTSGDGSKSKMSEDGRSKYRRSGFCIDGILLENLIAYCQMKKVNRSSVIRLALANFLYDQGLQPDKRPIVKTEIEYADDRT